MIDEQMSQPLLRPASADEDPNVYKKANAQAIKQAQSVTTLTNLTHQIEVGKNYKDVHGPARDARLIMDAYFSTLDKLGNDNPRLRAEFVTEVSSRGFGLTEQQAQEVYDKLRASGLTKLDLPKNFIFPQKSRLSTNQ